MSHRLTAIALATTLSAFHALAATADEKVTLAVPGIQCQRCIESLSTTLGKLDPSVKVHATLDTKSLEVTYDPGQVSLHQLVMTVTEAPPVHNMLYEAGVLVTIDDPVKSAAKVKKALGQIKGVANYISLPGGNAESSDVMILLRPLARNAKPADHVKASQIGEALEKNGVKFSGLPSSSPRGFSDDSDAKKKQPPGKTAAKAKGIGDDQVPEKSKPARPMTPPPPKAKSRDATNPPAKAKSKEPESDEKPRFTILAGDADKVFLVDHEGKTDDGKELKKLVKQGDHFGDYVVTEVGDDDGLYAVLEHSRTKEVVRVEHRKKEKPKETEKAKEPPDTKGNESDKPKKS